MNVPAYNAMLGLRWYTLCVSLRSSTWTLRGRGPVVVYLLSPILERTIRAQYRSTQVSLTCCFDKHVLQWMGDDAFDVPCSHLFQGSVKVGTFPDFSDCAEYPRTKIRAESSSNGSQLKLRTAGLTPHFHAELL